MTDPLNSLIESLRQELQQYGEMLARLDQQQDSILRRAADDVMSSAVLVQDQGVAIQHARQAREQTQRQLACHLRQPEMTTLMDLSSQVPSDYRPLVNALVEENNQLLTRVQQRARQNHLLLRRSLDMMQDLLQSLYPTGQRLVYNDSGHKCGASLPAHAIYDAAG